MKTKVYLRERKHYIDVRITSEEKPDVTDDIRDKWQAILDLIASLLDVTAALIMRITDEHMEVFEKSGNVDNPYEKHAKESLGSGLYCETVIGDDAPLFIADALESDAWKDNPDVDLDLINYYGLPLKWSDDEVFGTICVLDENRRMFTDTQKALLKRFQGTVESDLENMQLIERLKRLTRIDDLTGVLNRRTVLGTFSQWFEALEADAALSCVVMDLNGFKAINDRYGHQEGDEVLKHFAAHIKASLPEGALFGRHGGDEFFAAMHLEKGETKRCMDDIFQRLHEDEVLARHGIVAAYGVASTEEAQDVESLFDRADKRMLAMKHRESYER